MKLRILVVLIFLFTSYYYYLNFPKVQHFYRNAVVKPFTNGYFDYSNVMRVEVRNKDGIAISRKSFVKGRNKDAGGYFDELYMDLTTLDENQKNDFRARKMNVYVDGKIVDLVEYDPDVFSVNFKAERIYFILAEYEKYL